MTLLVAFIFQKGQAQSIVDVGFGASNMDNFFTNVAYRYQVNDNFRIGLETQFSSTKYRFVEAKPFEKGYATTISIPLSFKITEQERIRLDGFVKPSFRFQGIIDPDNNGIEDSLLNSRAVLLKLAYS